MDKWQERGQALDPSWTKQGDGGREGGRKQKGFEKGEFERERLHLLSKFLGIGTMVSSGARERDNFHGKGFA